jgi:ABC-2 type transport system permease protein
MTMDRFYNLHIILVEVKKSLKILLCYPMEILFWCIFPIFWAIPFIFQGNALVGGMESEAFFDLTGTSEFMPYILIGAVLNTYVLSALYGMSQSLRQESYWGTLELILGSPCSKIPILLGKAINEAVTSTLFATSQIIICVVIFGLEIAVTQILPIMMIVILLMLGLYGLSIALAGITIQIKESHSLIHTVEYLFYLFSPVRYPVQINPWIKMVSLIIPLTYALVVVRGITLLNQTLGNLWQYVVVLLLIDIVLIVLGYYLFFYIEKRARKTGVISTY